MGNPLRLTSLNHISVVCRSLEKSIRFYQDILGFFPILRPDFDFDGAWLFNYGIGIHLLQSENPANMPPINRINPKDNHISFQCKSIQYVEQWLKAMKIEYVKNKVFEGGVTVEQLFFHDPDGMMIEICNCDVLPVIPLDSASIPAVGLSSCPRVNLDLRQEIVNLNNASTITSTAHNPFQSRFPSSMTSSMGKSTVAGGSVLPIR